MAEQFSMPSMFDTRYAMDRQLQTDAHAAGIAGGGGKRYGMYYNSSLLGDRDNASLMSLTGMMGGQGDPRIQKQNAIDTIMKQYPNPETAEDFRAIANALQQQGLYDESNRAMSMANEVRSSMPGPDEIIIKEIKTTDTDGTPVTKTVRFNKTKGIVVEVLASAPTWQPEKAAEETYTYVSFPGTNKEGLRVDEKWKVNSKGERIELMSTQLKDKPAADKVLTHDEEMFEARLEPYVNDALAKIKSGTATTGVMSEDAMNIQARADGMRAISAIDAAADKADNSTTFTKNFDFHRSLMVDTTDGEKHKYSVDQALAIATSLDHVTVDEEDMKLQNKAILDDQVVMSALANDASRNERLNNQMLDLLNRIETGKWEKVKFDASQWLGDFDGNLADKEMFFSLSTDKVMEYTEKTKGAISDAEMTLFQQAASSLGKTTEGNRMLLRFAQEGAKATQRMAKHMRKWQIEEKARRKAGKLPGITFAEYDTQKEVYRNSAENASYFQVIINEDWKNAQDIGDSLGINEDLDTMRSDESSPIFAHCEKFPNDTICQM